MRSARLATRGTVGSGPTPPTMPAQTRDSRIAARNVLEGRAQAAFGQVRALTAGPTPAGTTPSLPDAPFDGRLYERQNGAWVADPLQSDAPFDGHLYGRQSAAWVQIATGGGGVAEAPNDGTLYGRKSLGWAHLAHTDITDWAATLAPYALTANVPTAALTLPHMDGTAAAGSAATFSASDHVHPTDTSRYAASNPAGYVTSAGAAGAAPVQSFNTRTGAITLSNADVTTVLPASSTTPVMNGTANVGVGTTWARADHVHPVDTSCYQASNPSGYQTAAQVTAALPVAASTTPVMDGTATVGVGTTWARADHVHPSDTSRYAASNPAGYQTAAQVAAATVNSIDFTAVGMTPGPGAIGAVTVGGTLNVANGGTGKISNVNNGVLIGAGANPIKASAAAPGAGALLIGASAAVPTWLGIGTAGQYLTVGAGTPAWTTLPPIPAASTTTPLMNGTAAIGSTGTWADGAHVHPTDTSLMPKSGGAFTGGITGTSALFTGIQSSGNLQVNGLAYFGLSSVGDFIIQVAVPNRQIQFTTGYAFNLNASNGNYTWSASSTTMLLLDPSGNLTVTTKGFQPGGGQWSATSDARIKDVESDYKAGLEEIGKLRPVVYRYKGNDVHHEGEASPHKMVAEKATPYVGLIAQEVEAIFPGMVTKGEGWIDGVKVDDLRTLDTTPLIFALVNAVKTLAARVDALEAARG